MRQETFTRVFAALRSGGGIREPQRLGAFVNSICNNVLLESYRSSSRNTSLEDEDSDECLIRRRGLEYTYTEQVAENVRRVIDELPERDRRLLKEVFLEERDKDEVCRDFGVDRDYFEYCFTARNRIFDHFISKQWLVSVRQGGNKTFVTF